MLHISGAVVLITVIFYLLVKTYEFFYSMYLDAETSKIIREMDEEDDIAKKRIMDDKKEELINESYSVKRNQSLWSQALLNCNGDKSTAREEYAKLRTNEIFNNR